MHRILRLPEVIKNTGLKRSTIYKMIMEEKFPVQVPLGAQSVGWLESDIENWIEGRISRSKMVTQSEQKTINLRGDNYANR